MKRISILLGLLCLGLAFVVQAEEPIVIKFSHVVAADTPKGKAAEHFAKLASEKTQGKVKVEVYANSTLYKDKEEMEALQIGSVQMLAPSLAKFGPLGVKEFEVFDLPYIFDGYKQLHTVTQGPIGKDLLAKLGAEPRRAFTRSQLLDAVWGVDWFSDDHVVDVHVGNLRKKLGESGSRPRFVHTVRGVGFRFEPNSKR